MRLAATDALWDRAEASAALAEVLALFGDEVGGRHAMDEAVSLLEQKGDVASVARLMEGKPG
jgi:hypothetical protein